MIARILAVLLITTLCSGCAALRLLGYVLLPDYPEFADGDVVALPALGEEVQVARRPDGLWRISASNEHDSMLAIGYLQARDRMLQLDLFRRLEDQGATAFVNYPPAFAVGPGASLEQNRGALEQIASAFIGR